MKTPRAKIRNKTLKQVPDDFAPRTFYEANIMFQNFVAPAKYYKLYTYCVFSTDNYIFKDVYFIYEKLTNNKTLLNYAVICQNNIKVTNNPCSKLNFE